MPLILGCDIGQAVDPTAIVVVESYKPEPTRPDDRPQVEFLIRWVERVPLGTSYVDVVERIAAVSEQAQLLDRRVLIVVDVTGVGKPIFDMLRRRCRVPLRGITFTAASDEISPHPHQIRVPKRDLVTALEVVLEGRRLHTHPHIALAEDLRAELQAFEVNLSARGHDSYEAARGKHDDLVMALCLAVWWGSRRGQGSAFIEAWRSTAAKFNQEVVQ
ncbi:MAG: hypothetical protein ACYDAL_02045 [Candidatus Dormibacteraceae bacterium]